MAEFFPWPLPPTLESIAETCRIDFENKFHWRVFADRLEEMSHDAAAERLRFIIDPSPRSDIHLRLRDFDLLPLKQLWWPGEKRPMPVDAIPLAKVCLMAAGEDIDGPASPLARKITVERYDRETRRDRKVVYRATWDIDGKIWHMETVVPRREIVMRQRDLGYFETIESHVRRNAVGAYLKTLAPSVGEWVVT